jgi:plasmid stabilization system protein ParE
LHPEAFADLDEIWEHIAEDNVDAADRVLADIHAVLRTLAASPQIGHPRPI